MKKSRIFLFLFLLIVDNSYSQANYASYASDAVKYNEMGNGCFVKGKYSEAIVNYNRSLELNSTYVASLCNRGSAYYNLRQFSMAIKDFDRVIELDSKFHSGIAYVFRASSKFNLGLFDEAVKDYSYALEISPNDARIYNDRANAYFLQDMYELAKQDYQRAYKLDKKGKAGKNARQKLKLFSKNKDLNKYSTRELLKIIEQIKYEWANELDSAGMSIAEKKYNQANVDITKSINLAGQIKHLLADNGLPLDKADAMEKLSLTYQNLNSLFKILENPSGEVDLIEVRRLVLESYGYLNKAQPNFKDAPFIEKICIEIRKGLDGVSSQINKLDK